jgi:hypothetical protein
MPLEINQTPTSVLLSGWTKRPPSRSINMPRSSTHSADDVVDKALNYVFSKDRDFQDFLKTPQAKQVASTLRVRKGPNKDAKDEAEQPTKKLGGGVESTASVRVLKV